MPIDPKLLVSQKVSAETSTWITKMNGSTSGTEFVYKVRDGNYTAQNLWEVAVQVPKKAHLWRGIIVRFTTDGCPDRKAVKESYLEKINGLYADHKRQSSRLFLR